MPKNLPPQNTISSHEWKGADRHLEQPPSPMTCVVASLALLGYLRAGPLARPQRSCVAMQATPQGDTLYEEYIKKRIQSGENVESQYDDLGADIDFDGGDSGSGAVGDGKVTLDDQHNSPFIIGGGGARDSVESAGAAAQSGQAKFKVRKVQAAVNARDVKAKNYWGREAGSGYAEELMKDDLYKDRPVLAVQLEHWHNQQALKDATDAHATQLSEFYGQSASDTAVDWKKLRGRPIDSIRSEIRACRRGGDGRGWPPTCSPRIPFSQGWKMWDPTRALTVPSGAPSRRTPTSPSLTNSRS